MKKICSLLVVMMIFAAAVACSSCTPEKKETVKTCEMAVIDTASVYKLQAFIKANEKIAEARNSLQASYAEKMKGLPEGRLKDLQGLFEKDMMAVVNKEMTPLKDRVQAAIAIVAAEKGITVVMDKSVVVTGAEDITDAVKDKFREEGELSAPSLDIGEKSVVAYFDQDVVRTLPMFRDADKKMQAEWTKAREQIAEKSKTSTPEQVRVFTAECEKRLGALSNQTMTPLLKKVTDTVNDVAKEKGYVLVVGKQYVMYGGKNITDQVADRLLGKKPAGDSEKK